MERTDTLRRWLRGRGLTPADIAAGLAWYEAARLEGRTPVDEDVLAAADASHAALVQRCLGNGQVPTVAITHQHTHVFRYTWLVVLAAACGGAAVDGVRWLVSALLR